MEDISQRVEKEDRKDTGYTDMLGAILTTSRELSSVLNTTATAGVSKLQSNTDSTLNDKELSGSSRRSA